MYNILLLVSHIRPAVTNFYDAAAAVNLRTYDAAAAAAFQCKYLHLLCESVCCVINFGGSL